MRILLVEDEPLVALVAAETLEGAGNQVEVAQTGSGALAQFHDGYPRAGLLVTEARLPDMSGWDVLEACRTIVPGLPAVVLTSAPSGDFRVRSYAVTLQKPFGDEALLAAVRSAIAGPSA